MTYPESQSELVTETYSERDSVILNPEFSVTLDSLHLSWPYKVQPSFTYHPEKGVGRERAETRGKGKGFLPCLEVCFLELLWLLTFFLTWFCFLRLTPCCSRKTGWCPHFQKVGKTAQTGATCPKLLATNSPSVFGSREQKPQRQNVEGEYRRTAPVSF